MTLKTNKQKGNYGEMKMDDYFESQGYERTSKDRVISLDNKISRGIDGVYENASPPPKYVIAEAKYNSAQLSNTKSGRQMGNDWIENRDRLAKSVGTVKAKEISKEMILNPDNIQKQLVQITTDGEAITSVLNERGYKLN